EGCIQLDNAAVARPPALANGVPWIAQTEVSGSTNQRRRFGAAGIEHGDGLVVPVLRHHKKRRSVVRILYLVPSCQLVHFRFLWVLCAFFGCALATGFGADCIRGIPV